MASRRMPGDDRFGAAVDDFQAATERFSDGAHALNLGAESLRETARAVRAANGRNVARPGSDADDDAGPAGGARRVTFAGQSALAIDGMSNIIGKIKKVVDGLGDLAHAVQKANQDAGTFEARRRAAVSSVPVGGSIVNAIADGAYDTQYFLSKEARDRRDPDRREYENWTRPFENAAYPMRADADRSRRELNDRTAEAWRASQLVPQVVPSGPQGRAAFAALSHGDQDRFDARLTASREATARAESDAGLARFVADRATREADGQERVNRRLFGGNSPEHIARAGREPGPEWLDKARGSRDKQEDTSPAAMMARLDAYRRRADSGDGDPRESGRMLEGELKRQQDYLARAGPDLQREREGLARATEKQLAAAEKDYDLTRRKTGELRAQAEILRDRADRFEDSEISYGMMEPAQQEYFKSTAILAKERGFGALTPEQKGMLAGNAITKDFVTAGAKEQAEKDAGLQALYKEFGQDTAKQMREKAVKMEQEFKVNVVLDEEKFKATVVKIFDGLDVRLHSIITKEVSLKEQQIRIQQAQAAASKR